MLCHQHGILGRISLISVSQAGKELSMQRESSVYLGNVYISLNKMENQSLPFSGNKHHSINGIHLRQVRTNHFLHSKINKVRYMSKIIKIMSKLILRNTSVGTTCNTCSYSLFYLHAKSIQLVID